MAAEILNYPKRRDPEPTVTTGAANPIPARQSIVYIVDSPDGDMFVASTLSKALAFISRKMGKPLSSIPLIEAEDAGYVISTLAAKGAPVW